MRGRFVIGIIAGGLIGAALGLLYAPRSGRETRRELKHKTVDKIAAFRTGLEKSGREAAQSPSAR